METAFRPWCGSSGTIPRNLMRGLSPHFAHGCVRRSFLLGISKVVRDPSYLCIGDQWGGWVGDLT